MHCSSWALSILSLKASEPCDAVEVGAQAMVLHFYRKRLVLPLFIMKTSVLHKLLRIALRELGTGFRFVCFHAFRILALGYHGSLCSHYLLPVGSTYSGDAGRGSADRLYPLKPKNPI